MNTLPSVMYNTRLDNRYSSVHLIPIHCFPEPWLVAIPITTYRTMHRDFSQNITRPYVHHGVIVSVLKGKYTSIDETKAAPVRKHEELELKPSK